MSNNSQEKGEFAQDSAGHAEAPTAATQPLNTGNVTTAPS